MERVPFAKLKGTAYLWRSGCNFQEVVEALALAPRKANARRPATKTLNGASFGDGSDSVGMPESETNPTKATQQLVVASEGEPVTPRDQTEEFLAQLHETLAHSRQLAAYLEAVIAQAQKDLGNTEGPPEIVDPLKKR